MGPLMDNEPDQFDPTRLDPFNGQRIKEPNSSESPPPRLFYKSALDKEAAAIAIFSSTTCRLFPDRRW